MDVTDVVSTLDEWAREALIDDRLGVPPDARLDIEASSSGILIGHIPEGSSEPRSGIRTRGFNLNFELANEPDEVIESIPMTLRAAAAADPTLGGRFRPGDVEIADDRPLERRGDPDVRGVVVRVRVSQLEPAR